MPFCCFTNYKCFSKLLRFFKLPRSFLLKGNIMYKFPHKEPALAPILPARKGNKTVTIDWLVDNNKVSNKGHSSEIVWLDDNHIVYSTSSSTTNGETYIEILNIVTKERSILCNGSFPKPSSDGKWVAYEKEINKEVQLWLIDCRSKVEKQLTFIEGGLTGTKDYSYGYAWSPDSKELALFHSEYVPIWQSFTYHNIDEIPKLKEDETSAIVDQKQVSENLSTFMIDVINISTGNTRTVYTAQKVINELSWLPNGKELLFMSQLYGNDEKKTWIYKLNLENNSVETVQEFIGVQRMLAPRISKDGKQVAFLYDTYGKTFCYMKNLGVISLDKNDKSKEFIFNQITSEMSFYHLCWSSKPNLIYVIRLYGPYRQLYLIDTITGDISQLTNDPITYSYVSISPDGDKLLYGGKDAHGNYILKLSDINGTNEKILQYMKKAPDDISLSEVREVEWDSIDYPVKIRGLLVLPLNYEEGKKYPLIVDIHGGGAGTFIQFAGAILTTTPLEWQLWAAKGYAVLVPEYRSSGSFGSLAFSRDLYQRHDLINCDTKDAIAGVDMLIKEGIANEERLAVMGCSAGSRRTNWIIVSSNKFKAAISREGWADDWLMAMHTPDDHAEYGGPPVLVPQNYQKNSCLFHAKGASTPTLFMMGNSKLGGGEIAYDVRWLYYALKDQNVPTQYVYYPDEGHGLERKANQKDALVRVNAWLEKYIGI
jgi:dipeptidyl aminopeptidase/acylaminoacyl peptidase